MKSSKFLLFILIILLFIPAQTMLAKEIPLEQFLQYVRDKYSNIAVDFLIDVRMNVNEDGSLGGLLVEDPDPKELADKTEVCYISLIGLVKDLNDRDDYNENFVEIHEYIEPIRGLAEICKGYYLLLANYDTLNAIDKYLLAGLLDLKIQAFDFGVLNEEDDDASMDSGV